MFIDALFVVGVEPTSVLITGRRDNRMQWVYSIEYYAVVRNNELRSCSKYT